MARSRTEPSPQAIERFARGIKSVDKLDPHVKIAVYGDNGSGKTRLAGTAPKLLVVDVKEKGTRSIVGSKSHVREVSSFQEIGYAYWYLKRGDHPYKSVAIDTVTMMYSAALDLVMKEAEDRDPTLEKSKPTWDHYGRAGVLVAGMVLAFRNLPMHVIFIVQEKQEKDADGDVTGITMDLPPKARSAVKAAAGIVGHIRPRKVGNKWVDELFTGKDKLHTTKDRSNILQARTRNPNMPDIIRAWNTTRKRQIDG